jgi:hypothetical protein
MLTLLVPCSSCSICLKCHAIFSETASFTEQNSTHHKFCNRHLKKNPVTPLDEIQCTRLVDVCVCLHSCINKKVFINTKTECSNLQNIYTFPTFLDKNLLSTHYGVLNFGCDCKVLWFYTQYIRQNKYLEITLHFCWNCKHYGEKILLTTNSCDFTRPQNTFSS